MLNSNATLASATPAPAAVRGFSGTPVDPIFEAESVIATEKESVDRIFEFTERGTNSRETANERVFSDSEDDAIPGRLLQPTHERPHSAPDVVPADLLMRMLRSTAEVDRAGSSGLELLSMDSTSTRAALLFKDQELLSLEKVGGELQLRWMSEHSTGGSPTDITMDLTTGEGAMCLSEHSQSKNIEHFGSQAVLSAARVALMADYLEKGPLQNIKRLAKMVEGTERANFTPFGLNSPAVRVYLGVADPFKPTTVAGTVIDKTQDEMVLLVGKTRAMVIYPLKHFPELKQVQMLDNLVIQTSQIGLKIAHIGPADVHTVLTRNIERENESQDIVRNKVMHQFLSSTQTKPVRTDAVLALKLATPEIDRSPLLAEAQRRARWATLEGLETVQLQATLPRGSLMNPEALASLKGLLEDRFDGSGPLSVRGVEGQTSMTLQVFGVIPGQDKSVAEVATYVYDKKVRNFRGVGVSQFEGAIPAAKLDAVREVLAAPGLKLLAKVAEKAVEVSSGGVAISQKRSSALER